MGRADEARYRRAPGRPAARLRRESYPSGQVTDAAEPGNQPRSRRDTRTPASRNFARRPPAWEAPGTGRRRRLTRQAARQRHPAPDSIQGAQAGRLGPFLSCPKVAAASVTMLRSHGASQHHFCNPTDRRQGCSEQIGYILTQDVAALTYHSSKCSCYVKNVLIKREASGAPAGAILTPLGAGGSGTRQRRDSGPTRRRGLWRILNSDRLAGLPCGSLRPTGRGSFDPPAGGTPTRTPDRSGTAPRCTFRLATGPRAERRLSDPPHCAGKRADRPKSKPS